MIYGYKLAKGYVTKLPHLPQALEFSPGLNILFAPNGAGKTSLLRVLAGYCCIRNGAGWSRFLDPDFSDSGNYEKRIARNAMGCEAKVDWSGQPVFSNSAQVSDTRSSELFANLDGITTHDDEIATIFGHASQGQLRLLKLNRIASALKNPPNLLEVPKEHIHSNDVWQEAIRHFIAHVQMLRDLHPDEKRMTVLWDEPDRSLDIPLQSELWGHGNQGGIRSLAKYVQVIVATHCPFALFIPEAKLIDMKPGYVEKCKEIYRKILLG